MNERANAIETNKLPEIVEVDTSVATLLNGIDAPDESEFPLRELRGLDKTMQTYRDELVNNLGKLSELDKSIDAEETKLKGLAEDHKNRPSIEKTIRDLQSLSGQTRGLIGNFCSIAGSNLKDKRNNKSYLK